MFNELSRYTKTNAFVHNQNQKNHYNQLINPRSTMKTIDNRQTKHLSLNHNNKYSSNIERERQLTNKRLNKNLMNILKGKGILRSM